MVKQIIISNFKRKITNKELKRIIALAKSITSNKNSIVTTEAEYPQKGIREIKFEIENIDNHAIVYFIFQFLSFFQNMEVVYPSGEWYSIRCGSYNIMLIEGGLGQPIFFSNESCI